MKSSEVGAVLIDLPGPREGKGHLSVLGVERVP